LNSELKAYTCPPMEDSSCVRKSGTVFSIFGYGIPVAIFSGMIR
jgi:hypothetical protein